MACGNGCSERATSSRSGRGTGSGSVPTDASRLTDMAMDTGVPVEVAAGTVGRGGVPLDRPVSLRSAAGVLTPLSFQVSTAAADDAGSPPVAGGPGGGGGAGAPPVKDDKEKQKWFWVWTGSGLHRFPVPKDAAPETEEPEQKECLHDCQCNEWEVVDAQFVKNGSAPRAWPPVVGADAKFAALKAACKTFADTLCSARNPPSLKCHCPAEPECDQELRVVNLPWARTYYASRSRKVREKLPSPDTDESAGKMYLLVFFCRISPPKQCAKGK